MATSTLDLRDGDEIQRLRLLLPDELKYCVDLARSTEINTAIIHTQRLGKHRFNIQLDLIRWQLLKRDQRDLLFWHEVARIQNRAIARNQSDFILIGAGLGTALIDTALQNVLLLSGSLLVAGLAAYQLYQRNRGERSLKQATAADQSAIAIAMQFGYTFPRAYHSLYSALTTLIDQAPHNAQRVRYAARQNVLEIFSRHHNGRANTGSVNADDRPRHSRSGIPAAVIGKPEASLASKRYFSF